MTYLYLILSWFLALIFALFTVSMFLMGNRLQALALAGVVLVLLPPARTLIQSLSGRSIPWWLWAGMGAIFLFAFVRLGALYELTDAIYKSPEVKAKMLAMYDAKIADWPVPYESVYLETEYGRVHVIISGPADGPPVLLLHASGVAGWSWLPNVETLSQTYRTYIIDTLGDAGRSQLNRREHYPQDGRAQANLYANLADQLGIEAAYVVGASEGGFIGTNYALYHPERVKKLVLLGPMGYTGTTSSILRITLAQFFPLKPIQDRTIRWAFGESPQVLGSMEDWFRLLMSGTFPQKARPTAFGAAERQSLRVPVLLVLGKRDPLVGDPEKARALVQDIADIRVEIIDAGHLLGVERPDEVNTLIVGFFE